MIIEVTTHGSAIRRKRDRFVIEIPEEDKKNAKTEIPAEKVDAILVTANSMISTQAVKLCMEKQIQMVLAGYTGRPYARMWASTPGRATELRRKQYLNSDTIMASRISQELVLEKLRGQRKVLLDLKNNRSRTAGSGDVTRKLADAADMISRTRKKVEGSDVRSAEFRQMLLGFEGSCAASYFGAISSCLPQKWQFERRSQNPGLDPFNAALNYMYGVGYAAVEKTVILSGLDPNAGFYHVDSYGKPTLVFDIMEICRFMLDKTLISLFSKKVMRQEWFEAEKESESDDQVVGVRISKEGRGVLLSAYLKEDSKSLEKASWDYCRRLVERLAMGVDGGAAG